MLRLEITEDKNHDPMLVIFLLTSPHPASQLHLRHSANGVPHARLFIIFSHIALFRVATLSSTFRQWSTPVRDHRTFSLTSPHPVLQLCLRHYANGVPPCYFISFTNFLFSLATFHFLTPHPHHLFLPM
jgi:hypothetical protein